MKHFSATCILVIFVIGVCQCAVPLELFECTKGVPYIENHCSSCHCITDNQLVCTLHRCLTSDEKIKEPENCETGTVWKEKCNKCWCTNAGSICTNYECSN
ncbi:hypothetical protein ILUMI_09321 [Ignelater luminosus]|uniref:Protease inhibitor n=1 Tax=Ignelater luminosus TaxID=2038154 RepID=A0A8K0D4G9_IGNLU|nr:hypothetical protein ILUMI_09321 [Ignelater luminosus]